MEERTLLNHVAIKCKDEKEAEIFFTEVLGFPLVKKFSLSGDLSKAIFSINENVDILVYDNDETRFEVFIGPVGKKHGYEHICIEIDDKTEFISRCSKYNIEPITVEKDGKNLLFFRDYSGNLFEIKEKN
jgi:catechol 2,3-dioxygenase-like lactoylglutathione lyase family enzyme